MLAEEIIRESLEQAAAAEPVIHVCARLHLARVLTKTMPAAAEPLLRDALAELQTLALTPRDKRHLEREAYLLAAAVAPDLALAPKEEPEHRISNLQASYFRTLLSHGFMDYAIQRLLNFPENEPFPHGAAGRVMHACPDDEVKRALLRRAVAGWKSQAPRPLHRESAEFWQLFMWAWPLLPQAEAQLLVQDVVSQILRLRDVPISGAFDVQRRITFTSEREHQLFRMFHIIRRLDQPLAEALLVEHSELAAAIKTYPLGQESARSIADARSVVAPSGRQNRRGIIAGSLADVALARAVFQAQDSGDFTIPFQQALDGLAKDSAYNMALKECWPSTQQLRSVLFEAGKASGESAQVYLDRIPDPDVRLFAKIEFAAALLDLPAYSGMRVEQNRTPQPDYR